LCDKIVVEILNSKFIIFEITKMIYLKETFKYLKRSFLPLLVVAIIPAVLLGLFTSPFTFISFLPLYYGTVDGTSFNSIFDMLMFPNYINLVFPYIILILFLILFLSYGLGTVEKHFKTGKRGFTRPLRAMNNSALPILKTVPIMLVALMLTVLIQTAIITLIRHSISGLSNAPLPIDSILVTTVSAVSFGLVLMASIFAGVWAVIIQIYGYSFKEAFIETIRAVRKKWGSLFLGLLIPITLLVSAQVIYNSFLVFEDVTWESWLAGFVSVMINLFILIYYMAYIPVSVYHMNNLERRDNQPPYLRGFR